MNDIKEDDIGDGKKGITIKRCDIFKTLFKPASNIKNLEKNKFHHFCDQYPFFKTILKLIKSFKDIFGKNTPELLTEWINKAGNTGIKEIVSFTNGVDRDYDAVKSAAYLSYNNGLAEGSVNKIKVIKRVMHGLCNFEILRSKTIQLEKMR